MTKNKVVCVINIKTQKPIFPARTFLGGFAILFYVQHLFLVQCLGITLGGTTCTTMVLL